MTSLSEATDLLTDVPLPEVAAVLRGRREAILARWQAAVSELLPDADPLTYKQVRNTIPRILDQMANTLGSSEPVETARLFEITKAHGSTRFHQAYDVGELLVEYRLLRRFVLEELIEALGGLTGVQTVAVNMALDVVTQQAVIAFTNHQKDQIRAAAEAESRYFAFLTHDLRNRLNYTTLVLQMHGRTLKKVGGLEAVVHDLDAAQRSIFGTIAGMERLLRAEQLRKGAVEPKREPVDLRAVAAGVADGCRAEAERKGLTLRVDLPAEARVQSDGDLIELILNNLVGNAVKYSSDGTVTIAGTPVAGDLQGGWHLTVTDEGPGIAPDQMVHLFDAFRRGETHGQQGLGLGLAIASSSAKLLGTELEVESTLGEGTRFRLMILHRAPTTR